MPTKSKKEKVKEHLIKKGHITSWEAIEKYRSTRLAAIIFDLRKDGMKIESKQMSKKGTDGDINFVKYVFIR